MDIDEHSVNDILDEDLERWSDFSIEEELPLLTNSCEEIASDIDTLNATLKLAKNRHTEKETEESYQLSRETAENNNTCLCQEDSCKSADVLFNNKDIMAEEVIEIILEQIIANVIHPGQIQDVLRLKDEDYFYVNNDDQVST